MDQNDSKQNNFFLEINDKLQVLQKNLSKWLKADKKKVELVDEIIKSEQKEIDLLQSYLKEIKLYIVIKGTISSGKSTFINSLLGCQLLPQKAQECTKQIMEIMNNNNQNTKFYFISQPYGDQIKINDQQFQNPADARKLLEEFQKTQDIEKIKIEFPSLFHKEIPPDLRKRIIFVDTPGIRLNKIENKPYQILKDIIGKNHVIQTWISNYTTFDSDKEEIFSFLQAQKADGQHNDQNFFEVDLDDPEFMSKEIQEKQCIDKLLFLLNKYDERDESEDDSIENIIQDICQKIGDENFIYKISASDALQFRVMTFGDDLSQKLFVSKYFINNKKKMNIQNEEQCHKICLSQFARKSQFVDDQDYSKLIHQLKQQIYLKINNDINGPRLTKILAQDFCLQMILENNLKTVVQHTDKLKTEIIGFIKIIHDLLTKYENDITKYKEEYNTQIGEIFGQTKKNIQDLNFFKKLFKGNIATLQQLCKQVLDQEEIVMKKIRELNKQYQNIILSEIKRVEEQNGKIQELSNTCQRLFDQFSEKQSQCIEMLSFKSLQDHFYDNLGVELTTPLYKKIGIVSSLISGGVIVGDSIAGYCAASTLITPVGVAATGVLGVGFLFMAIKKMIVENKFNSVQDVESKLILLENVLNSRIAEVCQNFISNNNQTIQCLKELFKVFAEGHLYNSQSQSDSSHQDSACLQYDQTKDEEFFQMSFKEQQKQYQAQSMQYWDKIQGKFFSKFNSILEGIGKNILFWKNFDSTKLDLVQNLIEQEENEYNILKDIKIYIVIKGTISAGKSTFLNALLGGQILPQKESQCTKQIIEITYKRINYNQWRII